MKKVAPYAKALTGAAVAGLSTLGVALAPTQAEAAAGLTTSPVTGAEWVSVGIATLTALAVVWAVPNAGTKEDAPQGPLPGDPI